MKKLALAAFMVAAGFSAPTFAQGFYQGGWYADLGVGRGKIKVDEFSDTKTAYSARVGARINPNVAIDGGYYNFGKRDDQTISSWAATVVLTAPIDAFDIYGRIGYARTEVSDNEGKAHKSTGIYGAGARYMFSPQLGAYVEYLYQKPEDLKIDAWLAGVQFRF